jgi:integrase
MRNMFHKNTRGLTNNFFLGWRETSGNRVGYMFRHVTRRLCPDSPRRTKPTPGSASRGSACAAINRRDVLGVEYPTGWGRFPWSLSASVTPVVTGSTPRTPFQAPLCPSGILRAGFSRVSFLILIGTKFMALSINLTRRIRRRKLKSGEVVEQTRYVLNWGDPRDGGREQRFFERQKDAQEKRAELLVALDRGTYSTERKTLTVGGAVAAWLETKRGTVRAIPFSTYKFQSRHVVGPLAPSEARRAIIRSGVGARAKARDIELLGRVKVHGLTTRQIRAWHKLLSEEVSVYSANKALMILKASLALAAEDHEFRPPAMPTGLQRRPETERKAVLTPDEVAKLLAAARGDHDNDIYAAFPFLAGTRPSEQLGLLWDDVDFEANVIRIRRIQMRDGSLSEFTKTAAGVRSIPMSPLLREMLLA